MKPVPAEFARLLWISPALSNFILAATLASVMGSSLTAAAPVEDPQRWEKEIRAFEVRDRTNMPPKDAFLFVGSSSIRMWRTLETDFAGLPVITRGFGGSQLADSVRFVERIITPYEPKMVLVYAGDNDLAAKKTPDEVLADFKKLVTAIHSRLPKTRVAFIAIKPSVARWALIDQVRAVNESIKAFTKTDARLEYIDVFTPMLNKDGQPRRELLVEDGLHLNSNGYELWTQVIKPYLK